MKINLKHVEYFDKIRDELIENELKLIECRKKVDAIKKTREFQEAYSYFGVYAKRGHLKERPTLSNGYKIELSNDKKVLSISDIKEILTDDQLKLIDKLLLTNIKNIT